MDISNKPPSLSDSAMPDGQAAGSETRYTKPWKGVRRFNEHDWFEGDQLCSQKLCQKHRLIVDRSALVSSLSELIRGATDEAGDVFVCQLPVDEDDVLEDKASAVHTSQWQSIQLSKTIQRRDKQHLESMLHGSRSRYPSQEDSAWWAEEGESCVVPISGRFSIKISVSGHRSPKAMWQMYEKEERKGEHGWQLSAVESLGLSKEQLTADAPWDWDPTDDSVHRVPLHIRFPSESLFSPQGLAALARCKNDSQQSPFRSMARTVDLSLKSLPDQLVVAPVPQPGDQFIRWKKIEDMSFHVPVAVSTQSNRSDERLGLALVVVEWEGLEQATDL